MAVHIAEAEEKKSGRPKIGMALFSGLLLLLVAASIVRSAVVTRLDGFTVDEAYLSLPASPTCGSVIFVSTRSILRW